MPYEIPSMAGKPYRPSHAHEGEVFRESYCYRCVYDDPAQDFDHPDACNILSRTLLYQIGDPEYPEEWTHDGKGRPTCTAFEAREEDHDAT